MSRFAWVVLYGLIGAVSLCGPARAQESNGTQPPGDRSSLSSGVEERMPGTKSGTTALLWSFLGTAAPAAACLPFVWAPNKGGLGDAAAVGLAGALLVGPSLGHFYAGRPGRAFAGVGLRTLAGAAVAVGLAAGISEGGSTEGSNALAAVGAVVGGAVVVWDIVSAPKSAKLHNQELREGSAVNVGLLSGPHGLGLRASLSF
jgi:hypothetical protein